MLGACSAYHCHAGELNSALWPRRKASGLSWTHSPALNVYWRNIAGWAIVP